MAEGAAVERKFARINTIAGMYDYDPRELRDMCLKGEIPGATKTGKEWRIPIVEMDKLMSLGIPRRHRRNNTNATEENSRV